MGFEGRRSAAMLPASDMARAKQWYIDTLGLKPGLEDESGIQFTTGDRILIELVTPFAFASLIDVVTSVRKFGSP